MLNRLFVLEEESIRKGVLLSNLNLEEQVLPHLKAIFFTVLLIALPGFFEPILASTYACPLPNYIPKLKSESLNNFDYLLRLPDRVNKPKGFNCAPVAQEKLEFVDSSVFSEINGFVLILLFALALLFLFLIAIIIERTLFFFSAKQYSEEFLYQFKDALRSNHSLEAFNLAVDYVKNPAAKVTLNILRVMQSVPGADSSFIERCNSARNRALAQNDMELKQGLWSLRMITRLALLFGIIGATANLLTSEPSSWQNFSFASIPDAFPILLLGIFIATISLYAHKRFSLIARQVSLDVYKSSWETFDCFIQHKIRNSIAEQAPIQLCFDY